MSNVRIVQDVYAAFGRGEMPAVLAAMDPKIEWRQAESHPYEPDGKAWVGPDAVLKKLFMRIGSDWDAFKVHSKEFHDAGETVVVLGRYTGTFKPTGRALDAQHCHVWKIRGGKVVSFQQFVDTAQLQAVMGTG